MTHITIYTTSATNQVALVVYMVIVGNASLKSVEASNEIADNLNRILGKGVLYDGYTGDCTAN